MHVGKARAKRSFQNLILFPFPILKRKEFPHTVCIQKLRTKGIYSVFLFLFQYFILFRYQVENILSLYLLLYAFIDVSLFPIIYTVDYRKGVLKFKKKDLFNEFVQVYMAATYLIVQEKSLSCSCKVGVYCGISGILVLQRPCLKNQTNLDSEVVHLGSSRDCVYLLFHTFLV